MYNSYHYILSTLILCNCSLKLEFVKLVQDQQVLHDFILLLLSGSSTLSLLPDPLDPGSTFH